MVKQELMLMYLRTLWGTFPADFVVSIGNRVIRPRTFRNFADEVFVASRRGLPNIVLYPLEFQANATHELYSRAQEAAAVYLVVRGELLVRPSVRAWKKFVRGEELVRFYNK